MRGMCELYRHFDKDGRLLYVGISISAVARLATHKIGSEWYGQIVRIEIERFESRREALDAESAAITNEKPLFNLSMETRRGPKSRSPEAEAERQALIQEAKEKNIRIKVGWSLSTLRMALDRAQQGFEYPYQ